MRRKFLSLSLVASSLMILACNLASHPSDEVLEQRLRSHQEDFNKLVVMLQEDSDIVRLDHQYVFLNQNSDRTVPKERLETYRNLFSKLGLEGGIHRDKPEVIRFIASSKGMLVPNSEKSYVYSGIELAPLVSSLDAVIQYKRGDQRPVYKKLVNNWYLFYESW